MVVPVGSLVNAGAVVIGASLGLIAGNFIGEKLRASLFQVLGLCTILIGLSMALTTESLMPVILACVLGIATGELLRLADRIENGGEKLKGLFKSSNEHFTEGLVTATLIMCVGAMGLVGSLEEGLGGSRSTLYSKSILDFCSAMMLASAYGSGVVLAAVPLLIYQGSLTILAGLVAPYMTPGIESALIATGGLLIVGIGTNLLGVKRLSLENLLPALFYAIILGMALE